MEGYLAARSSNEIRAMAMVNGVVDLQADLEFRPEMEQVYRERMPGYADNKAQLLRERSALAWAEELPKRRRSCSCTAAKTSASRPATARR
jgi:hypothetical protein